MTAFSTRFLVLLSCLILLLTGISRAWQSDNGDGTFTNPVVNADYPDPDIIRVGTDFYMVSSTFVQSPGINLLHSKDMVNWQILGQVASEVGTTDPFNMINGTAYEGGYWAPSIRYRNGTFYVVVNPTFANARVYYATNPAGPWQFHQLDRPAYDPGFFIDDDGTGYIACGGGSLTLLKLNANYSQVVSQTDNFLNAGGEGSHMLKHNGWYYVFNANPGIWPFQLRCSRATSLTGPWETKVALNALTGGHQGAIVDLADGNWFGFVHQDSGAIGRMPRIGPVFWENNWPVFGTPTNRDVMPATGTKPVQGQPVKQLQAADDFSSSVLGPQWQWNHNPDNTRWSLTQRPGFLRLRPTQASGFWTARNTLTQRGQGPKSHGVVKLDLAAMQPGDVAGFGTLGKVNGHIAVTVDGSGNRTLGMNVIKDKVGSYTAAAGIPFSGNTLYLRTDLDFTKSSGICSYSSDGVNFTTLGGRFELMFGYGSTWQGQQFAMFCYNTGTSSETGYVDVDSFTFGDTAEKVSSQRGRAKLNAARTTFVADNGQLLRGPYESTEWTTAAPEGEVARIKELGCNTVHLYAEVFDPYYPNVNPNTGQVHPPGYSQAEMDKFVQMTRDLGLYLVITIGNGANNGNHNKPWAVAFWNHYAARYKDETHVLYEIHNEPVAWGPPYLTATTPTGALDMNVDCYNAIRSHAPDTPVLLFTYAVFGDTGGTNAALTDVHEFNQRVFGNSNAVWSNEVVGFHGYAGAAGTAIAVNGLLAAGYPCMMTEFIGVDWASGEGQDIELTSELERMGVSWNCFLTIPPYGVSPDVTKTEVFKDLIDRAGMAWTPDYGTWPVARGPYGNGGQPRKTTTNWSSGTLQGALRIQAEDFDTGGSGVAWQDSPGNAGGQYRTGEGVDIATTSDSGGGHKVGWTENGEWMEYTIWVAEPGTYDLRVRGATPDSGRSIRVWCNGKDVSGVIALPQTGGYETWATVSQQVFLEFGRQKLRVEVVSGGFDLNWVELSPSATGNLANGVYKIVNRHSGLAMDGSGSEVVQASYTGATSQQWLIEHVGAGNYRVSSVADNDRWTNAGVPNEKVGQVWWWGADAAWQRFLFRPAGGGFQRIVTASFGRELEPQSGSMAAGAFVVNNSLAGYDGSARQQWAVQALNAPGIPTGLHAGQVSGGISLGWNAVTGAGSYVVKRSTTSGGPYTVVASGVAGTAFVDTTALAQVDYFYVVSAVVSGVEGLNSGEATAPRFRAWLKFDESSGTTAADSSGNNWNGTLVNGPTWTSGKRSNAVNLDGTNDHVTLPAGVVNGLTDFTIATWVKLDTVSTWSRLFDFGTGTDNHMFLTPRDSWSNVMRFVIKTATGGERVVEANTALTTGSWKHVAVTRSQQTVTIYLDGMAVGSNSSIPFSPSDLGNTTQNRIGRSQYNDPSLDGQVDDFRIYERALSAADLAALVAEPPPLPDAPANVSAVSGIGKVTLEWNAVANAASYVVKRSTTSGGPYTVLASGITAAGFEDATVASGTTYFYVIHAVNETGEGPASAQVSAGAAIPPSALWLKFDEGSGTNAADRFGSAWNGTLVNGAGWTGGRTGGAVNLDGTDDHVTLPAGVVSGFSDITLSAWVKLDTAGTWTRVFDFGSSTDNYVFLTTSHGNTGIPRFAIRTPSTGEQIINGNAPFPTGVWTHVAVTLSGTTGTLYVNGSAVGTNSTITLDPANLGNTTMNYLGKSQWADPYLDGALDDFRIHGRALTASEITEAARGLRARLLLDETTGTTAADATGNGWNGTLVNGTAWTVGRTGNAAYLDGSDDHLTLPTGVLAGVNEMTISAWVKPDTVGTWARVFDIGSGTNNYTFLTVAAPGGNPRFAIRTPSTGEQIINGNAPLATGVWSHVAVTLSGSTGTLYVNGAVAGTNTTMTLKPSDLGNTAANYIGKSQWADPYFDGLIDDFRIHDSALPAATISVIASQPAGSNLVSSSTVLATPRFALQGGQAGLTVGGSVNGWFYQLQHSDSLLNGSWQNHGDPVPGNGGDLILTMPVDPLAPRRFFRIAVSN